MPTPELACGILHVYRGVSLFQGCPYFRGVLISGVSLFQGSKCATLIYNYYIYVCTLCTSYVHYVNCILYFITSEASVLKESTVTFSLSLS